MPHLAELMRQRIRAKFQWQARMTIELVVTRLLLTTVLLTGGIFAGRAESGANHLPGGPSATQTELVLRSNRSALVAKWRVCEYRCA